MQERQKDIAKATVPVLRALGSLEKMDEGMKKALAAKKKAGGQFADEDKLYFKSTKDFMKELKDSDTLILEL